MKRYFAKAVSIAATLSLAISTIGILPANAAQSKYAYVDVTAQVNQTLAFDIVSATDATTTVNTCALGTLSNGAVNSCSYALRIATNASSGFVAGFRAVGELTNGTANFNHVADGTVTTGTEEYGLRVFASADGGYSATNTYASPSVINAPYTTDQPINMTTSTPVAHFSTGPFDSHKGTPWYQNSTLIKVRHSASISVGTAQGAYTQRVWWEVTASP